MPITNFAAKVDLLHKEHTVYLSVGEHPYIVRVLDFVEEVGYCVIVMEVCCSAVLLGAQIGCVRACVHCGCQSASRKALCSTTLCPRRTLSSSATSPSSRSSRPAPPSSLTGVF